MNSVIPQASFPCLCGCGRRLNFYADHLEWVGSDNIVFYPKPEEVKFREGRIEVRYRSIVLRPDELAEVRQRIDERSKE